MFLIAAKTSDKDRVTILPEMQFLKNGLLVKERLRNHFFFSSLQKGIYT